MPNRMHKMMISDRARNLVHRQQGKNDLIEKCGDKAFLLPSEKKFPIVSPYSDGCTPDCKMLFAAFARANQWGYKEVANKALSLYTSNKCAEKTGVHLGEHKVVQEAETRIQERVNAILFEESEEAPVVGGPVEKFEYEITEHGKEEFQHFQEIWGFAKRRGCADKLNVTFDESVVNMEYNDLQSAATRIQELEIKAATDYKCTVALAMKYNDIETADFFRELMEDELNHYKDLQSIAELKYAEPCEPKFWFADNYHDELIARLNKFIKDEISAAIGYTQLGAHFKN